MTNLGRYQAGMSKWGWLLGIGLVVVFMTVVLRLGPHYIDFRIVESVVERLPPSDVHQKMSRDQIRKHFQKQFRIENFRVPVKEMLQINRDREQTVLDINYEIREHMFYNVDVVLSFSRQDIYE